MRISPLLPTRRHSALAVALFVGLLAPRLALAADPTIDQCLAASEDSLSLRKAGKLGDARKQVLVCASASCPGEVRTECESRLRELNTAQPTLVLEAKDAAGNDLSTVRVTMDGAVLVNSLDGRALAIDPGEHKFKLEISGQTPVERTFIVREGDKERRERVVFGIAPTPPPAPVRPPAPTPPLAPTPTAGVDTPSAGMSPLVPVGIAVGVVGLAGIGVGTGLFLKASSTLTDSENACQVGTCTVAGRTTALQLQQDAIDGASNSHIAFVVGGVLAATGVVLVVVGAAKGHSAPAVTVVPAVGLGGARGLAFNGTF